MEKKAKERVPEANAPAGAHRRKRFILVVDDHPRDAVYACILLQNLGYTSSIVRSAEEALEFVAMTAPTLMVSELVLPGMNGLDLFEHIDRDPSRPTTPLIITTRFTDRESEDACRRAGCAGCLNKPVQSAELFRAVQQAIEPTPRQNIRVPVLLNASIDEGVSGKEFVTMLSDSGLFVKSMSPSPAGSRHTVTFLLEDRLVRADAIVLYADTFETAPHKEPGMGMKFLNLSPPDKDRIQAFIRERINPPVAPRHGG